MKLDYRDWDIKFEYGRFAATHKEFDASYEGPEQGWVGSHPTLEARLMPDLIEEIDNWYEEQEDAST